MKTGTSWDNVSDWYDELLAGSDTYQSKVILPNLLRLVGAKKGMKILDLACGQGFFSEAFVREGVEVIGVDISSNLIKMAKERVRGAKFFVASAEKISFIPDHSIDVVLVTLAIQNIQNISAVFCEVKRVLSPKGKMFLVLNHPSFRIPGASAWGFDEISKKQYRRIDSYLTESKHEIDMHPGKEGNTQKTVSFHRPLQVYFKVLANNGLAVSRLEEWISHKESGKGPRKEEEDRTRKEFPLFLCLEVFPQ
ncbi:MAG: class I SAM-dependent methyltransferase [Candidatus Parcubacteria bacterium]|nr:class I SAM-dependent methyltransferase [Candidatus Parcubacteria bacterium]